MTRPAMSNRPATVTQADVARTLRAAKQVGAVSAEVRLPNGTAVIVRLDGGDIPPLSTGPKPTPKKDIVL